MWAFMVPRKGEKDQSMWFTLIFLAHAYMIWLKERWPVNSMASVVDTGIPLGLLDQSL